MEVILIKDVDGVGKAGSVVKVKDGFAANYLMPHALALPSTAANLKKLEDEKKKKNILLEKAKLEAEKLQTRLSGLSLTISVLVQEGDKLYANVNAQDISRALKDEGYDIDKNSIMLEEPIKALGIYEVSIKLHPEVTAKIKLWVVKT